MIIPAGYRMLLKMDEVEEVTAGGIILPQQTKDADEAAQEWGTVVALGPFCYHDYQRPWCGVGDKVSITRYAGKVVIDRATGEKLRAINDIDIHCLECLKAD